jgi:hypothetical protein
MEEGIFSKYLNKVMNYLFGSSWRTSFFGLVTAVSASSAIITQYLTDLGTNKKYISGGLIAVAVISNFIKDVNSKDRQVTGTDKSKKRQILTF